MSIGPAFKTWWFVVAYITLFALAYLGIGSADSLVYGLPAWFMKNIVLILIFIAVNYVLINYLWTESD